jgi:hypothetical protein
MKVFRRLLGGTAEAESDEAAPEPRSAADSASPEEEERQYELDLAREEARRLDELQQRQLRYTNYSWTPPAQGGERRADDEEAQSEERSEGS